MRDFEHCIDVLKLVTKEGVPFSLAVNSSLKKSKNANNELRSVITSTCGGLFRHYYSLTKAVSLNYPDLEEDKSLLLALLLSNKLFSRRIDEEKLFEFVKKETGVDSLKDFLSKYNEPKLLIPEEVHFGSDEYHHLRSNLPLWLTRMWRKNLGPLLSKKLFKTFGNKDVQVLRIDRNNISYDDFFKKYSEYATGDLEGLAYLNERVNKKQLLPVKEQNAIDMHAGYAYMMRDIDVDIPRGIAVYGGCSNEILDELYVRHGTSLKIDYLCGNQKHFFEVKKKIQRYGIMDISIYECSHSALRTCISRPVHTFFLSPENSALQRLSEESDYFLSVEKERLDEFIKIQNETLEEASLLVEDGGQIIYAVPTLCKNESFSLIKKFVETHPEYTIKEETQLLPFDKYHSMLYFAILEKGVNHD